MKARRLSGPQLQTLMDAWNKRVYQRRFGGRTYSWNTRTDKQCTQSTNSLFPDLLILVDLPRTCGLESQRFIPTVLGEQILIEKGMLEQP